MNNDQRVQRIVTMMQDPRSVADDLATGLVQLIPRLRDHYQRFHPHVAIIHKEAINVMTLAVHALYRKYPKPSHTLTADLIVQCLEDPKRLLLLYRESATGLSDPRGRIVAAARSIETLTHPDAGDLFVRRHRAWMVALGPAIDVLREVTAQTNGMDMDEAEEVADRARPSRSPQPR